MASSVEVDMDSNPGVFSANLYKRITSSKVLVVGAGGIGCEILKNLVLSGFPYIEVIDLDTIDVSNLNRQFLFHKEHVGKSKSQVARESALSFNPKAEIIAHHDSITSNRFGVGYFQQFTLVLNALDNRAARNHVNRMCLTANVPLIESGTAGYNGQVELIKKGLTQCYECTPKAAQKSFPGCTIRNTPSEPIHCIVWAKHLFNQLFGEHNADDNVSPDTADPEAASEAGAAALEGTATETGNVERQSTRAWAQACGYDVEKLFNKFFHDDINYLLSMSNLWKNRRSPQALLYKEARSQPGSSNGTTGHSSATAPTLRDQQVWTILECLQVLADSIVGLRKQVEKLSSTAVADQTYLVWDKDDKHGMDFVAACANIRAHCFHIPRQSRFEIKSMAGNIIPAIATTNAITAGVVVMHAFRVLMGAETECQNVYMRLRPNARHQIVTRDRQLTAPNPRCYVCSSKPEIVVRVDTDRMTIKEFREEVLVKALNTVHPDVLIDGTGTIVISSEEGETEENDPKALRVMGIVDGCVLRVDDFHQNYELGVIIVHRAAEYDQPLFEVIADADQLKPATAEEPAAGAAAAVSKDDEAQAGPSRIAVDDDDDDLCIIDDDEQQLGGEQQQQHNGDGSKSPEKVAQKRKPSQNRNDFEPSPKKCKSLSAGTPSRNSGEGDAVSPMNISSNSDAKPSKAVDEVSPMNVSLDPKKDGGEMDSNMVCVAGLIE